MIDPLEHPGFVGLLRRLLPDHLDKIDLVLDPAWGRGVEDRFRVGAADGALEIQATDTIAAACALHHYLRVACDHRHGWDTPPVPLPLDELPSMPTASRSTSFRHRYYLNFCSFSYTTPFWDRERWQSEIDWMALHGINLPLAITGVEAVWHDVLTGHGLSDERVREYLGGPAYLPFHLMACLDGHAGPLPKSWLSSRPQLQQRILQSQRDLGMTPVLPGFNGHVPTELAPPNATRLAWFGFETTMLDPTDQRFFDVGTAYLRHLIDAYGTNHYYAVDPFIEMVPRRGDKGYLRDVATAIQTMHRSVDPEAVWVLQSWMFSYRDDFWTPSRVSAFLDALDPQGVVILDLWAEQQPLWHGTAGFGGRPWLWCLLHNFGGRPGPYGDLGRVQDGITAARRAAPEQRPAGLGLTMEAMGTDAVVYEYALDHVWGESPLPPESWIESYARTRYGGVHKQATRGWKLLLGAAYSDPHPGPTRSILTIRPTDVDDPRHTSELWPTPDTSRLADLYEAWVTLMEADVTGNDAFERDVADVGAQVLALLARRTHSSLFSAIRTQSLTEFELHRLRFVELITDADRLLGTRPERRFETWLRSAIRWAEDDNEAAVLRDNAMRLVTTWGQPGHPHSDYSSRHWSGLLRSFHLPRWRIWLEAGVDHLRRQEPFDPAAIHQAIIVFERAWLESAPTLGTCEDGSTLETARSIASTYADAIDST